MIYLQLFWEFFKTGLFAIGGGMATVPFLFDISARTGWFTASELANMIAVSESTPGPIGINMATYVGFETAGILGSVIATLGLVVPSIIIIVILRAWSAMTLKEISFFASSPYFKPQHVSTYSIIGKSKSVSKFVSLFCRTEARRSSPQPVS
ncbi:MAG: chromate transporter, partial [Spirochaetales bacterium]|nr:chromate transporter [Spirochaetales bacterium]